LRLGALIHALWRFHEGLTPNRILTLDDINRGIDTVEFYLGQTVDAMRLIEDPEHCPADTSEQIKHLAETLESLRGEVDSGRLAVGFIQAQFNQGLSKERQIGTAKAMGALLRSVLLTMAEGHHDANGHRAVSCLKWDSKTEKFLETCLQSLQSLQTVNQQCFTGADIRKSKSAMSAKTSWADSDTQTLQTLKNRSLQPGTRSGPTSTDYADVAGFVPVGGFKIDWARVQRGAEKLRERATYPNNRGDRDQG
jgi:hypothetical protein